MSSRLLALPRELRDLVHESTFAEGWVNLQDDSGQEARNSGLLGTNKQLRREAFPVYYEHTTFIHIAVDYPDRKNWGLFFPAAARPLVKNVYIGGHYWGCNMSSLRAIQMYWAGLNDGVVKAVYFEESGDVDTAKSMGNFPVRFWAQKEESIRCICGHCL